MQVQLIFRAAGFLTVFASASLLASSIPPGTPIHVQIDQRTAMSVGQKIEAHTVDPIYVSTEIVIPVGTKVNGTVSALTPDGKARKSARFDGDFTPLHTPVIQFTSLTLPDNRTIAIDAEPATQGAPQVKILSVSAKSQSLARQLWNQGMLQLKQTKETITAPGKTERLTDYVYGQLPYHPQRIRRDTQWTFDLAAPLEVAADPSWQSSKTADTQTDPDMLRLHAYLAKSLNSASSNIGERFEAVVTQPLYAADHSVEVPVGAVLIGQVTEAKPAKRFGRDGKLRFVFRELNKPEGQEGIQGTATAAITDKSASLELDSEGGFKAAQRNRLMDPLILGFLGTRALDEGDGDQQFAKNAVSSNGFGLVGRIAGSASGSANVATGFGMYALAVSFYRYYIARGKDVAFARGTRIEVEAVPSHGTKMPIR
ncbi:MAG TPA: hypothetical protein VNX22_08715 [Acidobacteriaceae bacterium]|nr:hypothetical protein [Acidobacteriaceae bacterium]